MSPEELLSDQSTAVVAVEGEIPAAMPEGRRFDVVVRSVPGTQTTSLEGGWLYDCNLSVFREVGQGAAWIPGKTVATAAGPVFMNPFGRSEGAATRTSLREGTVIGGGESLEPRRIRLLLTVPSYPRAIAMARRINERFGTSGPLADAVSPAEVRLLVPEAYEHAPKHFVSVVQHLFLPATQPAFLAQRTEALSHEFAQPDAPHVEIAFAWEGIGRTVLPQVQAFYEHENPACSFYSATAGMSLGDDGAVEVIQRHLSDSNSPYRLAAIRVLEMARESLRAARPLRWALNDDDPRIRVAAYEALVARQDPSIVQYPVRDGAFVLDIVPSTSKRLIYAKRTGRPRIALFGEGITAEPPVFYKSPGNELVVNAGRNATNLRLVRTVGTHGVSSPPVESAPAIQRLVPLLGSEPPHGLGVDYSTVVLLLSELCNSNSVNAKFMLEQIDPWVGQTRRSRPERPESER